MSDVLRRREGLADRVRDRLRRNPIVRASYQNLRFAWHATRGGLWRLTSRSARAEEASQAMRTWRLAFPFEDEAGLLEGLRRHGVDFVLGSHVVYLPPQPEALERVTPGFSSAYPAGAGVKLLRDLRGPEQASYLTGGSSTRVRRRLTGSARDLALAANHLHLRGLGARVWDVTEWVPSDDSGHVRVTAFVVDHVEGIEPSPEECAEYLERLRHEVTSGHVRILVPGWERKPDFLCPQCNGNLLRDATGATTYIDFQNFAVDRTAWLDQLVAEHGHVTHFGDPRPFNQRYLYQVVPGSRQRAKRDSLRRWGAIVELLASAGMSVEDRVVLDIGCNAGVMAHLALCDGASWAVGWDRPAVARFSEELLLALGSTRSTIVGTELAEDATLEDTLPSFVTGSLSEAVVLYLAVREPLGMMTSLTTMSWKALVYEGHQGESRSDTKGVLEPVASAVGASLVSAIRASDGDSRPRSLALLVRE